MVLQEKQSKVFAHRWSRQLHSLLRGRGGRHTSGAEPLGPVCRGRLTNSRLLQFQEVDGWNIRRVNNEHCRKRFCVAISAVRLQTMSVTKFSSIVDGLFKVLCARMDLNFPNLTKRILRCCIFGPAFGCCVLEMLVQISYSTSFIKKAEKARKSKKIEEK